MPGSLDLDGVVVDLTPPYSVSGHAGHRSGYPTWSQIDVDSPTGCADAITTRR
jgi:hypothetical protein